MTEGQMPKAPRVIRDQDPAGPWAAIGYMVVAVPIIAAAAVVKAAAPAIEKTVRRLRNACKAAQ